MTVRVIGRAVAIVLAATALGACAEDPERVAGESRPSSTTTRAAEPTGTSRTEDERDRREECQPSQADQLGPFYEPDAPRRASVGSGYVLSGAVLAAEDCRPLEGARLELWLATSRASTTMPTEPPCRPAPPVAIASRATCRRLTAAVRPTSTSA